MDLDKIDYIFKFYGEFMTDNEFNAWRHYSLQYKIDNGNQNLKSKESRLKLYYETGRMSKDPKVLDLLVDGFQSFKKNTAIRILSNNKDKIFFNDCSKCNRLARTPQN